MALPIKQQRFVEYYVKSGNGTKAAIKAGYAANSAHVQSSRLLTNAKVKAAIRALEGSLEAKSKLSAEWIIEQLEDNYKVSKKLKQMQASNKALELLGKHIAMFTDRLEHETGESLTDFLSRLDKPKDSD